MARTVQTVRHSSRERHTTNFFTFKTLIDKPKRHRKKKKKTTDKKPSAKKPSSKRSAKPAKTLKSKASKRKVEDVAEKTPKAKKGRMKGNDKLVARNLPLITLDPMFETQQKMPFISVISHSRLVIRAVYLNDLALLKRLKADKEHVVNLNYRRAPFVPLRAIDYAVKAGNFDMTDSLLKMMAKWKVEDRCQQITSLLERAQTGQSNFHMLGIKTRAVQMSRGGKEGNNALIKDCDSPHHGSPNLYNLLAESPKVNKQFVTKMLAAKHIDSSNMTSFITTALRRGNRKLAGWQMSEKALQYGFNDLHRQVLLNDKEPLKKFLAVSVKKKAFMNSNITPMHCAAINPNANYLRELLGSDPDFSTPDRNGYRTIHYAAVCEGPEPLKLLISKGASLFDSLKNGTSPLDMACQVGRAENVQEMIRKFKQNDTNTDSGWNMRNHRTGLAPIHNAAINGRVDVMEVFIAQGANIDIPASARQNKMTALMFAATHGHLAIVKLLYERGHALVEARDKLKRTALLHAAMNGWTTIVSYLVNAGADVDNTDSSGNSIVHYAAAYGWNFCLEVLADAGADLTQPNDWLLTPLAVAYLKGNMYIVDWLMAKPNMDINCRDSQGLTLLMWTAKAAIMYDTIDQLRVLIAERKADATLQDTNGNTVLHWLACSSPSLTAKEQENKTEDEINEKKHQMHWECISYLLSVCDPSIRNEAGQIAAETAVRAGHLRLGLELFNEGINGGPLNINVNNGEANLLHMIITHTSPSKDTLVPLHLFERLWQLDPTSMMKMLRSTNNQGQTPLLYAASQYSTWKLPKVKVALSTTLATPSKSSSMFTNRTGMKKSHTARIGVCESSVTEEFSGVVPEYNENVLFGQRALIMAIVDKLCNMKEQQNSINDQKVKSKDQTVESESEEMEEDDEEDEYEETASDEDEEYESESESSNTEEEPSAPVKDKMLGRNILHLASHPHPIDVKLNRNLLLQELLGTNLLKLVSLNTVDDSGQSPLLVAVENGWQQSAILLLTAGADPNVMVGDAERKAKKNQHKRNNKKNDKSKPREKSNMTVLMLAIEKGHVDVVEQLIKSGSNVKLKDSNGDTALHYAAMQTSSLMADVVGQLLRVGRGDIAPVENNHKRTALHLACNACLGNNEDSTETVEMLATDPTLLSKTDCRGRTPLHYLFVKIGKHECIDAIDPVAVLLHILPKITNSHSAKTDEFGRTALHYAAKRGAAICLMKMQSKLDSISVFDKKDTMGNTALSYAVLGKHSSAVLTLLQAGAQPRNNIVTVDGPYSDLQHWQKANQWRWIPEREQRPIQKTIGISSGVVSNNWQGIAYVVLETFGADMKQALFTLTEAALEYGQLNFAMNLMHSLKRQIAGGTANSEQLLRVFASHCKPDVERKLQEKLLDALMDIGVKLHKPGSQGRRQTTYCPALIDAARNHNITLCELLVEKSGMPNLLKETLTGEDGHTPFTALWTRELTDLEQPQFSAFMRKLSTDCTDKRALYPRLLSQLDTRGKFAKKCDYNSTPLIQAVNARNFKLCQFLINELNINVNDKSSTDGMSAMSFAVRNNDRQIVKFLLNHKYEPAEDGADSEDENKKKKKQTKKTFQHRRVITGAKRAAADSDNDEESNDEEVEEEPSEKSSSEEAEVSDNSDEDNGQSSASSPKKRKLTKKLPKPKASNHTAPKNCKSFPVTSAVDLQHVDIDGNTLLHQFLCPFKFGAWRATRILEILLQSGLGHFVTKSNNRMVHPLQMAGDSGQSQAFDLLKQYQLKGSQASNPSLRYTTWAAQQRPATCVKMLSIDVDADSKAFLAADKLKKRPSTEEKTKKKELEPHIHSDMKHTGEIVVCVNTNDPCSVLLNKVDIYHGPYGFYNFYRLQLIKKKGADLYVVFTNWGRIGDDGQYQRTPFNSLEDGFKEFSKIYKEKTHNLWADHKNFDPQPKRYRPVEIENVIGHETDSIHKMEIELGVKHKDMKPKTPDAVTRLITDVSNVQHLQNYSRHLQTMKDYHYNNRSVVMPFGRMKHEALLKAVDVLQQIGENLSKVNKLGRDVEAADKALELRQKVADLSEQFYTLVPFSGFQDRQLPIIEQENMIKTLMNDLNNMLHNEITATIIMAAAHKKLQVHPVDYMMCAVGRQIVPIDSECDTAQWVLQYIHNSQGRNCNPKVQHIYEVYFSDKTMAMNADQDLSDKGNRKMLWHGTDASNMLSILKHGLLPQPPNAVHTGSLYGRGVYSSDTFEKAANYARPSASGMKYIFLCEVALGETKMFGDEYGLQSKSVKLDGIDSLSIVPEPLNATRDVVLPTGVVVPLGQKKDASKGWWSRGNEYIVFKEQQVQIRYLIAYK